MGIAQFHINRRNSTVSGCLINMKLFRQVHPSFIQLDKISSQAFRPTPKDEGMLSCYNGSMITAEASYNHFISNPACTSAGVVAILQTECEQEALPVVHDGVPFPEHSSIDFSAYNDNQRKRKSQALANLAKVRGLEYTP